MKKKSVIIDFKIKINYYSLDLTGVLNELWDPIYKLYTLHYITVKNLCFCNSSQ